MAACNGGNQNNGIVTIISEKTKKKKSISINRKASGVAASKWRNQQCEMRNIA